MSGIGLPFGMRLFSLVPLVAGLGNCASVPGPRVHEGTDYGVDGASYLGSEDQSRRDTAAKYQRYTIRIQFDTACHVLKFVPHRNEPVPAELFERVGRTWQLLRVIPVSGKDVGAIDPPLEVQ